MSGNKDRLHVKKKKIKKKKINKKKYVTQINEPHFQSYKRNKL
jgi:hypothetical protein